MQPDEISKHIDEYVMKLAHEAYGEQARTQLLGQLTMGIWEVALQLAQLTETFTKTVEREKLV